MRIDIDLRGIDQLIERLEEMPERIQEAAARALNRAGDAATTVMGRQLAEETGLGVRQAREHISVSRASAGNPEYVIRVGGEFIALSEFAARQTRKGVSANPWATRRTFPHTFFGPGERVFHRTSDERLPIKQLWGPSLAREAGRGDTIEVAKTRAFEVFQQRFAHELGRLSGKGGGGDD